VTTRIRLLTWVLVLPYRNPLFAAHQIATVDALSAGRLILGVGTGYLRGEFHGVGADFDQRRAAFDEALDVFSDGWESDEVAMTGLNFSAPGNVLQPRPAQLPRPPVWVHGNGRWGTDRAARLADGWVVTMTTDVLARTIRTTSIPDLKAVASGISHLRSALDRLGRAHDDIEIVVSGNWPMLDTRVGWNVDQRLEQISELEDLGVTWVVANVIGDDPAASQDTVRRFGEEVVLAQDSSAR
jgi:probable F420-dependent oxidoreductase